MQVASLLLREALGSRVVDGERGTNYSVEEICWLCTEFCVFQGLLATRTWRQETCTCAIKNSSLTSKQNENESCRIWDNRSMEFCRPPWFGEATLQRVFWAQAERGLADGDKGYCWQSTVHSTRWGLVWETSHQTPFCRMNSLCQIQSLHERKDMLPKSPPFNK